MGSTEFPVISLFTGIGGIDQGLEFAGLNTIVCVEINNDRVATLKENRKNWIVIPEKIEKVPTSKILKEAGLNEGEVFMVAGGPPCQPFSKSAYWVKNRTRKVASDPRSKMLYEFLRVVKESNPRTFLLENVSGLDYKTSKEVLNPFLQELMKLGYNPQTSVLNAADYGVPQKRKRFFIIGERSGEKLEFPFKTHSHLEEDKKNELKKWVTAGDALNLFYKKTIKEEERIGGKYGHLLEEVPPGNNYLYFTEKRGYYPPKFKWRSKFWTFLLKLSPQLPSWTIQANPAMYQGPFHWDNRHLREEELKALQCIDQKWNIIGNKKSIREGIGNACPPLLIESIARKILEQTI